jgi:hypothetical protein
MHNGVISLHGAEYPCLAPERLHFLSSSVDGSSVYMAFLLFFDIEVFNERRKRVMMAVHGVDTNN